MIKNFAQISCVFCGSPNLRSNTSCIKCHKPTDISRAILNKNINKFNIVAYKARGFYGFTFKAKDENGKVFAVKLISEPAYKRNNKDFEDEAKAYAFLPDHPCIAAYIGTGKSRISIESKDILFFYIKSEWIEGPSLKDWISSNRITPLAVYTFATDILTAIAAFEEKQLWHNDLHEENILVAEISESQRLGLRRDSSYIFKIVDIGSARFRAENNIREISDLAYAGRHLAEICKRLSKTLYLFSKEDKEFINKLSGICARLTDEDRSRGFNNSIEALKAIRENWINSRYSLPQSREELSDPYGLINAMDIHSPKLIRDMFSSKFSYFERIQALDNHCLMITGPRGCGKTMILKRMKFETNISHENSSPKQSISKLSYIGFYISARMEFGNYLIAIREPDWSKNSDKTGLYFNCLVTLRLIDVLYYLVESRIENSKSAQFVIDFIIERLGLPPCDLYSCQTHINEITRSIILEDKQKLLKISALNATPAYLNDLTDKLLGTLQSLRGKEIVLLVDDLSWPRIPISVMKILSPFLFSPGSRYKVRVSAHSNGLITSDLAGEEYKANRDYTEINLGREYYELSENYEICLIGFNDIMNKRFRLAKGTDFPGLEVVLGKGDDLRNLGQRIKDLADQRKLRSLRYHGAHVFIKLCSGDLSYLVEILGLMSTRWSKPGYPITKSIQHDIIKSYSKKQLVLLQDTKTDQVSSLYEVALTFGIISKAQLTFFNKEHLRVEIELGDLDDDLKEAIRELLSLGVFVDGGYSESSSGKPARRLLFRRIFTPAFPTTVNNRETLPMRKKKFEDFIKRPKKYRQEFLSEHQISPSAQQQLEILYD